MKIRTVAVMSNNVGTVLPKSALLPSPRWHVLIYFKCFIFSFQDSVASIFAEFIGLVEFNIDFWQSKKGPLKMTVYQS